MALKLFTGIDSFEIMAIPFFILAGNFLTHGGVARRMINFATSMVGHWYGGLGLAGVMACALFAAVSGSSPATVIAIGSIILPAMVKQGFPKRFGAGVITTSGALGILIPPSIVMVIYCVATGGSIAIDPAGVRVSSASVGQMFMAGVIPGLMLATLLGVTTFYRAWKFDYPRLPRASWTERFVAFRKCMWGLLLILLVLGGIYAGLFTPTEAAAVSAVYAFKPRSSTRSSPSTPSSACARRRRPTSPWGATRHPGRCTGCRWRSRTSRTRRGCGRPTARRSTVTTSRPPTR